MLQSDHPTEVYRSITPTVPHLSLCLWLFLGDTAPQQTSPCVVNPIISRLGLVKLQYYMTDFKLYRHDPPLNLPPTTPGSNWVHQALPSPSPGKSPSWIMPSTKFNMFEQTQIDPNRFHWLLPATPNRIESTLILQKKNVANNLGVTLKFPFSLPVPIAVARRHSLRNPTPWPERPDAVRRVALCILLRGKVGIHASLIWGFP